MLDSELGRWLLAMNLWTAALLAGALLLDFTLARHARASWRIALYLPIALRLALPLAWKIPVAHAPPVVTFLTPRSEGFSAVATAPADAVPFSWNTALVVVYVAVALVIAFVRLRAWLHLRREVAGARRVASPLANVPCVVVEHDHLGPMVVGLLRPFIVLPSELLAPDRAAMLACVLGHETAHVRRLDAWLVAVVDLTTLAFWPLLPLWGAAQRVRVLIEMACDDAALDDADAATRSRYGRTLLEMTEWRTVTLSPLHAGGLHFGSGLRERIKALANVRRWPSVVQGLLVGAAVALFAACSSVGPGGTPSAATSPPSDDTRSPAKAALKDDLKQLCPDFASRFLTRSDPFEAWMHGPVEGIPADEVARCRGPEVAGPYEEDLWSAEARNVLGQMAKDLAAAWERESARGNYTLCPSDGPVPMTLQPRGQPYYSRHADWNDGGGFPCMLFEIDHDHPVYFQYTLETGARGFTITAHGQRARGDRTLDVQMVLRGQILPGNEHVLNIAPRLEETWKVL